MHDINTNSAPIKILNLLSKIIILTAYAHQHMNSILLNNPYLTFKLRPFRVLALKSGINRNFSGIQGVALLSTVSRSNWNLEMLVFMERGKPEYPEKNLRSRDEKKQQTGLPYPNLSKNSSKKNMRTKLTEILEQEDSYVEIDTIINEMKD